MVLSLERWRGKVAVITGASGGIGAALAERLVEEGLQVVGLARKAELIEQLSKKLEGKKGKLYAVKTDLRIEEEILKAFEWITSNIGPVHILVNNAGILENTNLIDGDTAKWSDVLQTNILAVCIATREAIAIMKTNKIDGHIIYMNSMSGHKIPNVPKLNIYPATKHAMTGITETLKLDLIRANSKIKISNISPGSVKTQLTHKLTGSEKFMKIAKQLPQLTVDDVTDAILYALSTPPNTQVFDIVLQPYGEAL